MEFIVKELEQNVCSYFSFQGELSLRLRKKDAASVVLLTRSLTM